MLFLTLLFQMSLNLGKLYTWVSIKLCFSCDDTRKRHAEAQVHCSNPRLNTSITGCTRTVAPQMFYGLCEKFIISMYLQPFSVRNLPSSALPCSTGGVPVQVVSWEEDFMV